MTVLRTNILEPAPVETHEVPETLRVFVPRMLDEGRETGGQRIVQLFFAPSAERACDEQRTGVVVHAIAMGPVRHAVYGVLEKTGVVAHRQEMSCPQVR